jgi:hypothetical protein
LWSAALATATVMRCSRTISPIAPWGSSLKYNPPNPNFNPSALPLASSGSVRHRGVAVLTKVLGLDDAKKFLKEARDLGPIRHLQVKTAAHSTQFLYVMVIYNHD